MDAEAQFNARYTATPEPLGYNEAILIQEMT